jgi:serine-aspartate repeat-containing protein C/D/E
MKKHFIQKVRLLVAALSSFALVGVLHAAPSLRLSDGTTTIVVTDGDVNDGDSTPGSVGFIGNLGVWSFTVTSGITKPVLGTATVPGMDVTATIAESSGAGTLTIDFADDFFGPTSANFTAPISGINDHSTDTVSYDVLVSSGNALFTGTPLSAPPYSFTGAGSFSGSLPPGTLSLPQPYALTQRLVITHTKAGTSTADAALIFTPGTGRIGDFVWNDLNWNGLQDLPGEPGIEGVLVELRNSDGSVINTTTTSNTGHYEFTGLPEGTYSVQVRIDNAAYPIGANPLTGFLASPTLQGSDNEDDSNANPSLNIVLDASNNYQDLSIDFGFYDPAEPLGMIGNFVWHDLDQDGLQGAGEPGIANVTVLLTKNNEAGFSQSTTTGPDGKYLFTGLSAGTYTVEVAPANFATGGALANYVPTFPEVGSDVEVDSNENPDENVGLVANNSVNLSIDFGYILAPKGTIGDFIWYDLDGDGKQDSEPGIAGVAVRLTGPPGFTPRTEVTDATGYYFFTGLLAGTYTVTVDETTVPVGLERTTQGAGTSTEDSNPHPTVVPLAKNESNLTVDFGYRPKRVGEIGDYVWWDVNGNGIQDDGLTSGLANVTVKLYASGNPTPQITTTDAAGYYRFTGLMVGVSYVVEVDHLDDDYLVGYSPTIPGQGSPSTDSNAPSVTVNLQYNSTTNSAIDLDADFGYVVKPLKVECPAKAGTVGAPYSSAIEVTGGVPPYSFEIVSGSLPPGLNLNPTTGVISGTPTTAGSSSFNVKVTDGHGNTATTADDGCCGGGGGTVTWNFNLPSGILGTSQAYTVNGIAITAYGFNNGGTARKLYGKNQGGNESGLGIAGTAAGANEIDVTTFVQLDLENLRTSGATNATMTVGSVQVGESYNVYGSNTLGSVGTLLGAPNRTLDNSPFAIPAFGTYRYISVRASCVDVLLAAVSFTLPHGCVITIAPVVGTGRIGNFVWKDLNHNGIQNPGEPGIGGVKVTLKNSSGVGVQTKFTLANGEYSFTDLTAGTYIVEVDNGDTDLQGLLPTFVNAPGSTTANDSNANPTSVTLASNSSEDLDTDFGFIAPGCGCIGNWVWKDLDCDGIQDCNEPGIKGVTVKLYWNGILIKTDVSDACGGYGFYGLWAGCYTVVIDDGQPALAGLSPTKVNAGSNRCYDSNPNPATVCLATDRSCDSTIDFGYKKTPPVAGPLTTCTMGGWGSKPSGNNPGAFLARYFPTLYPSGLVVGSGRTLKFTSARGIEGFLPSGGTASKLRQSYTNPTTALGVLAGQVVALRLGVDFSTMGITAQGLSNARFKTGKFTGATVGQVLALCEAVLGGAPLPQGVSYSDLSDACALVNENYDGGGNCGKLTP